MILKPIILLGTSGAAKEIYYLIKQFNNSVANEQKYSILGYVSARTADIGKVVCDNVKIIASDETLGDFVSRYEKIYAVIQYGDPLIKNKVIEKMTIYSNILYPNIIHPSVIYDENVFKMGEGNIIAAGCIIACNAQIGSFNLLNRSCTIGHDFMLGEGNTINPGSIISGNVTIGNQCLIGAGSVILENINIHNNATLGAGAVLTKNLSSYEIWVGVPAKQLLKQKEI